MNKKMSHFYLITIDKKLFTKIKWNNFQDIEPFKILQE